jgi:phosphoenolpyruvate---glycerone phosphotransferase subunit DhaK
MKLESADRIVDRLLETVLADLPFRSGDPVLAFVNGMGGTPLIELFIAMRRVAEALSEGGYQLERSLVGSYITSLEMAGLSITLLRLDDELVRLWDAPVHTAGLRWGM